MRGALHVPRIMFAASRSGEGKTTLMMGVLAALVRRGLVVGSAKVGPDFIDGGWHRRITSRPSRNLDPWMMGEAGTQRSLATAGDGANLVAIEGVMGLFDGANADPDNTSSAAVARLTRTPVIVVLDASKSSSTLAAVALGLARFDSEVDVVGVILNRFRAGRERAVVQSAFDAVGIPVLGWLPADDAITVPERALGLAEKASMDVSALTEALARAIERDVDLDRIVELACSAADADAFAVEDGVRVEPQDPPSAKDSDEPVVIAVAADSAFSFSYPDNLEALQEAGAYIVPFSPLHDAAIPVHASALYLGGGRVEEYAADLASNTSMRIAVRSAIATGMPTFAEGGGFTYLLDSVVDLDGIEHEMVGAIPGRAERRERLTRMGYRQATLLEDTVIGARGATFRGHEFRYSDATASGYPAFSVEGEPVGIATPSLLASYLHLHFGGHPDAAASFVFAARRFSRMRGDFKTGDLHE